MQREYTTTFLGITTDDIKDFITLRRCFDNLFQNRYTIEEITDLLFDHETDLKNQKEKYLNLIEEKQFIEKEVEEIKQSKSFNKIMDQSEKFISFPYQSFRNLRHWRKAPKSLKLFFQALTCLFSISNHDFLTELKINHALFQTIQFYHPSSIVIDEFRIKYSKLTEISPDYIRKKSLDAYTIAIWMHHIEENERLNLLKQPQIENQKRLENQLIQLNINLSTRQKEIRLTEDTIKTLKTNIDQTEKHRQHKTITENKIDTSNLNVEQRFRETVATLPVEQTVGLDVSKLYQQLIETFYAYECHLENFVFDRDMHNIIYSLGFVPSHHEMNQLILAMRYHPQSRTSEREEIDVDHHLIHISDFADIIIPKLLNNEYQSADEQYLLKCFKKVDQNNKNYLHKKLFIQSMSTMEDALDENEADDLLNFLTKNESLSIENLQDFFDYKRYIKHLLPKRHLIYLDLGVAK